MKHPAQFIIIIGLSFVFSNSAEAQSGIILASDSYSEASPANIYVVKPDGTGTCYVTADTNWNRNAGWSYDGSKIVYELRDWPGGIWTMDANGNNKTQICPPPAFGAAFSPDGNHIVYADYGAGEADTGLVGIEVWVMNTDGTGRQQLTKTTVNGLTRTGITIRWSCRPAYSPDGTKIVYACTQSGRSEIWVMNSDTTNKTQLTFPGHPTAPDANFASYSPDGTKIVFLGGYETEYGNIWVMNADSTDRTQLTIQPDSISSDEPAWSGDGNSIMFNSNRYDSNLHQRAAETWVMNADGSNQRVLFPHLYGEGRNPWRNDPVLPGAPSYQCDLGAGNLNQQLNFQIYPSPATEMLHISLPECRNEQIQIYNAMGMLIKEFSITQSAQINIDDLPNGLYIIHAKNESQLTSKFIKQ